MANSTISALPAASAVNGTDNFVIVQSGTTMKATVSQLPAGGASTAIPTSQGTNGLLAWSVDPALVSLSTLSPTVGTLLLFRLPWGKSATVTNVVTAINTAGTSLTNCYAGIYNESGTLLGTTADQSSAWQSTGGKTMALTSAVTVPVTTNYFVWAALLVGGGTDTNLILRSGSSTAYTNMGTTNATARSGTYGASLTALPSSITPSSIAFSTYLTPIGLS